MCTFAGQYAYSRVECWMSLLAVMSNELAPYAIPHLEGLELSEDVGRGSFGVVYEVTVNGLPCIAKRLHDILINKRNVGQLERDAIAAKFRDECVLLSRLRHPNVVQFLGVHFGQDRYDLTLVMERMHMDLEVALEKFPNIPLPFKIRILLDASYGLLHLHSRSPPVVHRDFTTANILLSPDFRAKIADLGVAKIDPHHFSRQTICPGALAYMSPEALRPNPKYGVELDVFSFGHVTLYTANQKFPIVYHELEPNSPVQNGAVQLSKRQDAIDKMGTDHCLYQLIAACLHDSPEQRPTTAQLNSLLQELSAQHPLEESPTHILQHRQLREIEEKEREDRYQRMADELQQKNNKVEELTEQIVNLCDQVQVAQVQAIDSEEKLRLEREDHTKASRAHEELVQKLEGQLKSLQQQLGRAEAAQSEAERERYEAEDMIGPLELVKQSLKDSFEESQVSLEEAREEVQVKTTQLKQYKKQVDTLKEQNAAHERQNMGLVQEMTRLHGELEKARQKSKPVAIHRQRSATFGSADPSIPERTHRKLEADYDGALQEITDLKAKLENMESAYEDQQKALQIQELSLHSLAISSSQENLVSLIPEEPPVPLHRGRKSLDHPPSEHLLSTPHKSSPSSQTHTPSHSPSRARCPSPLQPCHAPAIPPRATHARPQQPAISSTHPPERELSRSKQPSERIQSPAYVYGERETCIAGAGKPAQLQGTEQDHFSSHSPNRPPALGTCDETDSLRSISPDFGSLPEPIVDYRKQPPSPAPSPGPLRTLDMVRPQRLDISNPPPNVALGNRAAVLRPTSPGDSWQCVYCSASNLSDYVFCSVCGQDRVISRKIPFTTSSTTPEQVAHNRIETEAVPGSDKEGCRRVAVVVNAVRHGEHARVPFDPNLVCPTCKRWFRYGEIQQLQSHTKECILAETAGPVH